MARLRPVEGDGEEIDRLFALSAMGPAVLDLRAAVYGQHGLSVRIFEAVRKRIAEINGCPICLRYRLPEGKQAGLTEQFYDGVGNWRDNALYDEREKLALEFTEKFLLDHRSIDDAFFDRLKTQFTEPEIMNLTIVIARHMAFGRITMIMNAEEGCSLDGHSTWGISFAKPAEPEKAAPAP